jgi:hypothetical protein
MGGVEMDVPIEPFDTKRMSLRWPVPTTPGRVVMLRVVEVWVAG